MDDLLSEGADLIDDEDAPVATAPKAKPKAKAKTRKAKASTKRRTAKKATAKKAVKTKRAKASANGNKPKRERHAVVHQTPKAGSKFTATYKGKQHTMTVKAKDGGVVYVVKGKEYKTPSAAANALIDAGAKNGWTFWGIESPNDVSPTTKAKAGSKRRKAAKK